MKHKCDGCQHKGEHHEMMFRPMGVCKRGANLLEAIKNYEAEKCPYKKTNADRIRTMSDEELAAILSDDNRCCPPKHNDCRKYINNCAGCYLEWLQQPAEVQK